MRPSSKLIALGLAGAFSIAAAAPGFAGPLTGPAGLRTAAPDHVTEVRWRGRGIGPGLAFGLAAGALTTALVASQAWGPDYYYGGPVYAQPYGYEPVYPAPGYYTAPYGYYGGCYTDDGYGRRRPCSAN